MVGILEFDKNVVGVHPVPVLLTAASTLTAPAFGRLHSISGAATFATTLPTAVGNANKCIAFEVPYANTPAITFSIVCAAGQLAGGVGTLYMCAGFFLLLRSDGANWQIVEYKWPKATGRFMANKSADQALTSAVMTQIIHNTQTEDRNNWYDAPSGLYIPTLPGLYELEANFLVLSGGAMWVLFQMFITNVGARMWHRTHVSINTFISGSGAWTQPLGVGDYARPALQPSTTLSTLTANPTETFFGGRYVGPNIPAT